MPYTNCHHEESEMSKTYFRGAGDAPSERLEVWDQAKINLKIGLDGIKDCFGNLTDEGKRIEPTERATKQLKKWLKLEKVGDYKNLFFNIWQERDSLSDPSGDDEMLYCAVVCSPEEKKDGGLSLFEQHPCVEWDQLDGCILRGTVDLSALYERAFAVLAAQSKCYLLS